MVIRLNCGSCGQSLQVGEEVAGTLILCPWCEADLLVPQQSGLSLSEAESEQILSPLTQKRKSSKARKFVTAPDQQCPMCGQFQSGFHQQCIFCGEELAGNRLLTEIPNEPEVQQLLQVVRKFREQSRGLGLAWIMIAVVLWFLALILPQKTLGSLIGLSLGYAWLTLVLGLATCFRKMSAVMIGIGISYLWLIGLVIHTISTLIIWQGQLQELCVHGFVFAIHITIILQGNRILQLSEEIRQAGFPLNITPEEILRSSP